MQTAEELFDKAFVQEMRRKWRGYITYPAVWQVVRGQHKDERNLRVWLEQQWRSIPVKRKRASLRGDLRSENVDPPQHLGAQFELIVRAWLLQVARRVTVEPALQGTNARPDFRAWVGGENSFVVECVARSASPNWADQCCSAAVAAELDYREYRRQQGGLTPGIPPRWKMYVHLSPWQPVSRTQLEALEQLVIRRLRDLRHTRVARFTLSLETVGLRGMVEGRKQKQKTGNCWEAHPNTAKPDPYNAASYVLQRVAEKVDKYAAFLNEPLLVAVSEHMIGEWQPDVFAECWASEAARLSRRLSATTVCSRKFPPDDRHRYVFRVFHNPAAEHPLPLPWLPPCQHYVPDGRAWRWDEEGQSFVDCVPTE